MEGHYTTQRKRQIIKNHKNMDGRVANIIPRTQSGDLISRGPSFFASAETSMEDNLGIVNLCDLQISCWYRLAL